MQFVIKKAAIADLSVGSVYGGGTGLVKHTQRAVKAYKASLI